MKSPVKQITITRAEGPSELCGKPYRASSYSEANRLLLNVSDTAPKTGGYDKCDYKVEFENGETYEGRYDLKHWSQEQDEGPKIDLQKRIRDYLMFLAGERRPVWMDAEEWAAAQKYNEQWKTAAKVMLDTCDI